MKAPATRTTELRGAPRATARRARRADLLLAAAAALVLSSCKKDGRAPDGDGGRSATAQPSAQGATASITAAVPRIGMAWVAPGVLRAGTPANRTPRIPDEEMAGAVVELGGFYIDLLPWPNEPNAIPTSNVSRDEAEQLCGSKGKRLCTELEWERACKGPDNTTYEYGDAYRKDVCATGIAIEQASRRPTSEHAQCKSRFGVADMHGGPFEWTSSAWGRGSRDAGHGVLRGGNSVAGELVGRCANAIARAPGKKAPTMGFRCCAGAPSAAEVKLELRSTPSLIMTNPTAAAAWTAGIATAAGSASSAIEPKSLHAWIWTPVANEELVIALGCTEPPRSCGLVVGRPGSDDPKKGEVLAGIGSGKDLAEVVRGSDSRRLRFRALDVRGIFSRDITWLYGKVEIGEMKRP